MSNFLKENVKSADVMGIGYFYKQDQPTGYMWQQIEGEELWDVTNEQHRMIEKCFKEEMRLLEMGTHADAKTLLEFQHLTKLRCEELIKHFHQMVGYPQGKPMGQEFMNIEITKEVLQIISFINIQIYYMTQWETIPNDEYNGMNYVYTNIQFK
jgi:hypothetical protein